MAINYVSQAKQAEQVAQTCRDLGVQAIVVKADVTNRQEVIAMFDQIMRELGRIDIVYSNSGKEHWGAPGEVTEQEFDDVSRA